MNAERIVNEHLYHVFTENFVVRDIAEALVSVDAGMAASEARKLLDRRGYSVLGIREEGLVSRFVEPNDLGEGLAGDHSRPITQGDMVDDGTDFPTIIRSLCDRPRMFVKTFGQVGGIVTRTDLQKPPVRMWLFGMITIIEMALKRMIEAHFPGESWKETISPGRLQKAEALLAERKKRDQELHLIDCLQFSDKGQIIMKDEALRSGLGFSSRREGDKAVSDLESLRNSLAHSQDIISCDWDVIVRLSGNVEKLLAL